MGNLQVRFLEGWAPAMAPGHSTLGISSCLPVNDTGREPHPVEIASEPGGMSHARFDRSERGSTEVYERVGPSRNAYFVGMQKQRLLPSGSVTANSRSPPSLINRRSVNWRLWTQCRV